MIAKHLAYSAFANQLVTYLSPALGQRKLISVYIDEKPTGLTNGINIVLPQTFHGCDLRQDTAVSRSLVFGLLAHEEVHMFQPLRAVDVIRDQYRIFPVFTNLIEDIQGEAWIARLMPSLNHWLGILRKTTHDNNFARFERMLSTTTGVPNQFELALLLARFNRPGQPFDGGYRIALAGTALPYSRLAVIPFAVSRAQELEPDQLPEFIADIARAFPEICKPLAAPPPPPAPEPVETPFDAENQADEETSDEDAEADADGHRSRDR
ncbi:MAG: hypothetical protein IPO08_22585 [Xanthomonadales bacterium]|nr:hypothetical protein [Xanthomonadales bacterium]